jgi:hypothetical protein
LDEFQLREIQRNLMFDAKLSEALSASGGKHVGAVTDFLLEAYWGSGAGEHEGEEVSSDSEAES